MFKKILAPVDLRHLDHLGKALDVAAALAKDNKAELIYVAMTDTTDMVTPDGDADIIETDYEIGQDNIQTQVGPFGLDIHNPVFLISGLSIIAFVFYALALPEQAASFFGWLRPAMTTNFDWFFLGGANIFVLFCLFLIVSPWGSVRLGGADAVPDYGYPAGSRCCSPRAWASG
jgi:hypothetical protein